MKGLIYSIVILLVFQIVYGCESDESIVTVEGRIITDGEDVVDGSVTAVYDQKNLVINSCKADKSGNFSFKTPSGFDSLVAKASGFVSQEIAFSSFDTRKVTVKQDFLLYRTIELKGIVFDQEGFSVPNATVDIVYLADKERLLNFDQERGGVVSDEFGRYLLPFVAIGKAFYLYAATEESLPMPSEEIILNSENPFNVNIMIGPKRGSVGGELLTPNGEPVKGAKIILRASADGEAFTEEERFSDVLFRRLHQEQITDESGRFIFPSVPFGKVSLHITLEEGEYIYKELVHFSEDSSEETIIIY